jgi:hypothetical protein
MTMRITLLASSLLALNLGLADPIPMPNPNPVPKQVDQATALLGGGIMALGVGWLAHAVGWKGGSSWDRKQTVEAFRGQLKKKQYGRGRNQQSGYWRGRRNSKEITRHSGAYYMKYHLLTEQVELFN